MMDLLLIILILISKHLILAIKRLVIRLAFLLNAALTVLVLRFLLLRALVHKAKCQFRLISASSILLGLKITLKIDAISIYPYAWYLLMHAISFIQFPRIQRLIAYAVPYTLVVVLI
jgi:hypothetical protein